MLVERLLEIATPRFSRPDDDSVLSESELLAVFEQLLPLLTPSNSVTREQSQLLLRELQRSGLVQMGSPDRSTVVIAEISSEALAQQIDKP